jgi:hypothetical protein
MIQAVVPVKAGHAQVRSYVSIPSFHILSTLPLQLHTSFKPFNLHLPRGQSEPKKKNIMKRIAHALPTYSEPIFSQSNRQSSSKSQKSSVERV